MPLTSDIASFCFRLNVNNRSLGLVKEIKIQAVLIKSIVNTLNVTGWKKLYLQKLSKTLLSGTHLPNPKPNPFWMNMYFIPQKCQSIYSTS